MLLDASAMLALLLAESGSDRVEAELASGASISAVNLAEVIAKLLDYGYTEESIEGMIEAADLTVLSFEHAEAWQSGLLHRVTRSSGLSLGDRCCLAVAQSTGMAVLTCDRHWAGLNMGVEIELCR